MKSKLTLAAMVLAMVASSAGFAAAQDYRYGDRDDNRYYDRDGDRDNSFRRSLDVARDFGFRDGASVAREDRRTSRSIPIRAAPTMMPTTAIAASLATSMNTASNTAPRIVTATTAFSAGIVFTGKSCQA
jgi:hypothetical protein